MIFKNKTESGGGRRRAAALLLAATIGLGGCGNILDVENPNNLVEEELANATAARALVNGAGGTVARALGAMLGIYSTASDEVTWIGSRDAWRELDQGFIDNPRNEFTDDAFRYIAQARWTADEALKRLEAFDADGRLSDRSELARAYIFASIIYISIADQFDDFVIASDKRDPAPPVGTANMVRLYDTAIGYLDKGLVIAQATNSAELQRQVLGLRARAKFSKGVWSKLNPKGQTPADPLINDPGAVADAQAALALMPADYKFVLTLTNDDLAYAGEVSLAYLLNQRLELAVSPVYGRQGTRASPAPREVTLNDPITGQADPVLTAAMTELAGGFINQPITVVSAREMRLILAEAALARGDMAEFTTQINAVRQLNNLTPYSGQVSALELLKHSRRVNLFVQGRRLADMYRFGDRSPVWVATSDAVRAPGTLFPVTCIEIRGHPQDFPGITC